MASRQTSGDGAAKMLPSAAASARPAPDVPEEGRLVAGPAADDQPDLGRRGRMPGDRPLPDQADDVGVGRDEPLDHLVDGVERVVDQLLHGSDAARCGASSAALILSTLRADPPPANSERSHVRTIDLASSGPITLAPSARIWASFDLRARSAE